MKSNLKYRIEEAIKRLKKIRKSRILASERMYKYANRWNIIIFVMSITSAMFLIISLVKVEQDTRKILSACFSIYTLTLQYFVSTLNYRERGLKFHYHQIEMHNLILQLDSLLYKKVSNKAIKYNQIMEQYQSLLQSQENHTELDYVRAKGADNSLVRDLGLDSIFIIVQPIVVILFLVFYYYG
ncbi:SLATT domain-containing protein [Streptococcus moroccensis]|uniref:SMODS and SLOG-associating 2TM effector domain-containing protein n=1 Tax=Streptococcus moroccensis TaxID=1451356 RepID=A0ABT9YPL2_9STRE|nr:SLATT domain-containing protein [Streptococcus moroccensis]MDQ0221659.1 hypothetical protein [Streptococcus moroccensis]